MNFGFSGQKCRIIENGDKITCNFKIFILFHILMFWLGVFMQHSSKFRNFDSLYMLFAQNPKILH